MSSLDDKIKEILLAPFKDAPNMTAMHDDKDKPPPYVKQIAQLKQAFKDEGWYTPLQHTVSTRDLMSGREWLARFERELEKQPTLGDYEINVDYADTLNAAKKAAGLK